MGMPTPPVNTRSRPTLHVKARSRPRRAVPSAPRILLEPVLVQHRRRRPRRGPCAPRRGAASLGHRYSLAGEHEPHPARPPHPAALRRCPALLALVRNAQQSPRELADARNASRRLWALYTTPLARIRQLLLTLEFIHFGQ
ncbi:hypothetical protein AURDEDRAFT_172138 [Auricularia subglabra TFB-10046 SS5]|nr:hypothetical protein AURDEDRAFT_172138 [Auricularia subglabra TFB-10046 SS5]